ncbi:MAG TPA: hypothetical protein PKC30_06845 [Saprospiraceae bacterium]|nr:hypothetical protein [Saprospiraceae bacterium]
MLHILTLVFLFNFSLFSDHDKMNGAWKLVEQNGKLVTDQEYIKIYQDGYFVFSARKSESGEFISAGGGPYTFKDNQYIEHIDFFTPLPELTGKNVSYSFEHNDDRFRMFGEVNGNSMDEKWERISNHTDDLTGHWVFTGRVADSGESQEYTPGARRTIKILSGGHFQWVAFNSETAEFFGTGGGIYTAQFDKYTENIKFFSRDNNRVGASLEFGYRLVDGRWHHMGMSSKGDPLYEYWSPYTEAYPYRPEF